MSTEKLPTRIRREQIAVAALRILGASGKRLHMTDIAARMGLAPSALYRHFKNRDALLSAVLELIRQKLFANLETVCQTNTDALDRLRDLLFRHIQLIKEEHGIPRIVFSDELWGENPERKQKMYRIVSGYLAEIADLVRAGQEQDRIRSDIPPSVVAGMFFGILQPAALLWHMSEGRFDLAAHIDGAWPVFLETIQVN